MMRDFYTEYYHAVQHSRAHAAFCKYAYGKDLCQHGFTTMEALDFLLRVTGWSSRDRVLDVGCGNGKIDSYIAEATGAQVYGMDYIAEAIQTASRESGARGQNSGFFVGDLNQMPCAPESFDALLSADTLYFAANMNETLRQWARCTKTGGHLAILYSHGANPEQPKTVFDRATLPADKTPLGIALQELNMKFEAWDFTASDYQLAVRKKKILTTLKDDFEREGFASLYENRMGETLGVMDAIESGMHARYLYYARKC